MQTKIERNTDKPKEDIEIVSLLSKGKPLKLSNEQQTRIVKEIEDEFNAIKDERKDINGEDFDSFLESMDNQKYGRMPDAPLRAYNLDTGITRIKCDDIKKSIVMSLLDVDPIFSITPRLGFAQMGGSAICTQQQDFIDNVIDEVIPLRKPIMLAADSAVYKKVGVIKWLHKVVKEKRIRTESYKGNPVIVGQDERGIPIEKNDGLDDFLLAHGERVSENPKDYEWILKLLVEGKEAKFDIEYEDIIYDDPFPVFVDNKNFYVRKGVDGYDGLCTTRLIVERTEYTYTDLKRLEKDYEFINLDKLFYGEDGKEMNDDCYTKLYKILECVFYFKENEEDEEFSKGVFWIDEENMCYLGGINYPFTTIDCYYAPHYVMQDDPGFYQSGVAELLTDVHLSKNAILNHTLEAGHMTTTVTPITPRGSEASKQFQHRLWTNGLPIHARIDEIDFLSNKVKPLDTGSLLTLNNELTRLADDLSRSTGLRTGGENPLDPSAPAAKTAMLLQQSGQGVKDYIDVFKDGFNIDAFIILRMYYEIGQTDDDLRTRMRAVSGESAGKISRAALIARTNIQSQAMAYDLDQLQAKREDLAMNAFLVGEQLTANNPWSNYERVKMVMSSWAPRWRAATPKILQSPDEFNKQMAAIALQTTIQYFQGAIEKAKMTGNPPELNPEALMQMINQMQVMATAPKQQAEAMLEAQKGEAQNV